MHAVVRTYTGKGAKQLMDVLERNNAEVERLIRAVQGFVSFSLVRTASGGFSVSVFQDKAGTDESVRVAREWIAKNAANFSGAASDGGLCSGFSRPPRPGWPRKRGLGPPAPTL